MTTFLALTQQLVAELGIGGANNGATVPTAVTGQTGQLWNAVNWIKQAHNNIGLLHTDWNFLNTEYSESLSIGDYTPPAHSGAETVKKWNRSSLWLDRDTTDAIQLQWLDWHNFRATKLPGLAVANNGQPAYYSIKPDNTLILDTPPEKAYTMTAEFWKRPTVLTNDADVPDFPEEYHRLVVCEAAIKYGNKEAAIEIIQGMEAEYLMLLAEMEADQLPFGEFDRLGAEDMELTVGIPGYSDDIRSR